MNTEQNKALMRQFLVELDKGLDAVERFFSPDCLIHLPGIVSATDDQENSLKYSFLSTYFLHNKHSADVGDRH